MQIGTIRSGGRSKKVYLYELVSGDEEVHVEE